MQSKNLSSMGLLIFLCLAIVSPLFFPPFSLADSTVEGEIEGALFKILMPEQWNGKLLVIAHGFRPPEADLVADLDPQAPFMDQLVGGGWMVAKTSYRRNGLVIAEGLQDLDNLVAHVVKNFGQPQLVIMEGSSMGGSIAVKAAERAMVEPENNAYDGIVALGAAMDIRVGQMQLLWTYVPGVPVLFVSNRDELAGPAKYCRSVSQDGVTPALWFLDRDGHVNLNFAERMAALVAIEAWIIRDSRPLGTAPSGWDATISLGSAQSTARKQGGSLAGKVVHVDPAYGNILTSFVLVDLRNLALNMGDPVVVSTGGKDVVAQWGSSFDDVPEGEYVIMVTATGYIRIAINMGNAAKLMEIDKGDELAIRPLSQ